MELLAPAAVDLLQVPGKKSKLVVFWSLQRVCNLYRAGTGRGVSEKVSAVGFYLGSGFFGICNSD